MSVATRVLQAWRDLAKLPQELWILCFATFVNRAGTMALPFLALYLTESLGFSSARAGIALTLWGLVALFMGPVAGKLSDRWGALFMLETMMVAFGIVLLFFPLAHSWLAVLGMTMLFAMTNVGFGPPSLAMISSLSSPEQRKSAFALARLAINLGLSAGPAVGGFLAQVSFPVLFMVNGATALVAAAILVFSPFHRKVKAHEAKDTVVTRDGKWMLHTLFADANLRVFLLGIIPVIIVFWQHQSTMPLFLVRDLHFSTTAYGMLFTLSTLMIVTMEIPLNSVTSHWPHRRTFVVGCSLMAIGFGALGADSSGSGAHGGHLDLRRDDPLSRNVGIRFRDRSGRQARRVHGFLCDGVQLRAHGRARAGHLCPRSLRANPALAFDAGDWIGFRIDIRGFRERALTKSFGVR